MPNFAGCDGCTIRVRKIAIINNSKQAMKKSSLNFLFMMGLMATLFFACDNEDDGVDVIPPTISSPDDITVNAGADGTLTFSVTANGGYRSATVTSSATNIATATISTNPLNSTTNSGDVIVTVTGVAEGSSTITLTVTDQQDQESTDEVRVTVNAADVPATAGLATAGSALDTIANLSTLNAAVDALTLTATLDNADQVTIFAPQNAAFDSLLKYQEVADLTALVSALTAGGVTGILQAHIVADSLPADLLEAKEYPTLNAGGSTVVITKEGENVFVNGAQVVEPNITVGNGVIHIIDSVININATAAATQQPGVVRVASSADGVGTTTWTANNTYILDGFVYVNSGQTLTIEPGTVIKGRPGQAARASALIVARGGRIEANGTAAAPIIFTGEADDLAAR